MRLPTDFLAHLTAAARSRHVLELRDGKGERLAALPLYTLPARGRPEDYGITGSPDPDDRILAVIHRAKGNAWAYELIEGSWTWGNVGRDAPPQPMPPLQVDATTSPILFLELLGWAARLGTRARIAYEVAELPARELADLRLVPGGPVRATDVAKAAPRAFTIDKIRGASASLAWFPSDQAFRPAPPDPTAPRAPWRT